MIILHGGFSYLHMHGRVWLDEFTQVQWGEWIAGGRDPQAIVWRYGQLATGFGVDQS